MLGNLFNQGLFCHAPSLADHLDSFRDFHNRNSKRCAEICGLAVRNAVFLVLRGKIFDGDDVKWINRHNFAL